MVAKTTSIGKVYNAKSNHIQTIDFSAQNQAKTVPTAPWPISDTPHSAVRVASPTKPSELFFTKTFEFRLRGADVQRSRSGSAYLYLLGSHPRT